MKIFIDTNVWVAASISHGLCAQLIRLLLRRTRLEMDEVLMADVVRREYLRIMTGKIGASKEDLSDMFAVFDALTQTEVGTATIRESIPDPDDLPLLAAALTAEADVLVTGDKPLLELEQIQGMGSISPRTLYERLRGIAET